MNYNTKTELLFNRICLNMSESLNNLNDISKEILESNNNAIQCILEENLSKALDILKEAETKLKKNASQITDEKIKIIINHNLACCYQKQKNSQKCLYYLEKVTSDFDNFLSDKHGIIINADYFIHSILSDEIDQSKILGDFILELRFCAKFHLQICAAYSQNGDHQNALEHAMLASTICQDNISKTYLLIKKIREDIKANLQQSQYSTIFIQKLNENKHIVTSLNNYIVQIAKNFAKPKKEKKFLKVEQINGFIQNKQNKVTSRNVLGIIKNDDWLNLFNIGNIMYLCGMLYEDLELDSDNKYELLRDAIIEKILMLTVSFFSISNELRFLKENNSDSIYYHSLAIELSSLYLPLKCPIIKHYINSYVKLYYKEMGLLSKDINFDKTFMETNRENEPFEIGNDIILNLSEETVKIDDFKKNEKSSNFENNEENDMPKQEAKTDRYSYKTSEELSAYSKRSVPQLNLFSKGTGNLRKSEDKNFISPKPIEGFNIINMKQKKDKKEVYNRKK